MIGITGAGGTVGSEVVRQVHEANVAFRAAYHSRDKTDAARAKGIEAVEIDLGDPESMHNAFRGCERLFLLSANLPNQVELEIGSVDAARAAGVKHIVKLSALGADAEDFELGRIHREVEKAIEASGLVWTILRPNSFMQNLVTYQAASIRTNSGFFTAAGDGRISHIDIRDIAAVVLKTLTETGHENKAYDLTGSESLTYDDVAAAISDAIGRKINHVKLPPADLKGGMLAAGIPEFMADNIVDLQRHHSEGKAATITTDVGDIIGRDPVRFEDFARETAAMGVW